MYSQYTNMKKHTINHIGPEERIKMMSNQKQ